MSKLILYTVDATNKKDTLMTNFLKLKSDQIVNPHFIIGFNKSGRNVEFITANPSFTPYHRFDNDVSEIQIAEILELAKRSDKAFLVLGGYPNAHVRQIGSDTPDEYGIGLSHIPGW